MIVGDALGEAKAYEHACHGLVIDWIQADNERRNDIQIPAWKCGSIAAVRPSRRDVDDDELVRSPVRVQ
jgi:hypothetical protein